MTSSPHPLRRRIAAVALAVAMSTASAAAADPHDPQESGHPLEIVGTALYPVGWLVDLVVFRPLHWVAGRRWVAPVVNHDPHVHPAARVDPVSDAPAAPEPASE